VPEAPVVLRRPQTNRSAIGVWAVAVCVGLVSIGVIQLRDSSSGWTTILAAFVLLVIAWRLSQIAVVADGSGIVIRNGLGTRRLEWSAVCRVVVVKPVGRPLGKVLALETQAGERVTLEATRCGFVGPAEEERLAEWVSVLDGLRAT
jgi:hypothetical protein